jgi:MarR family 2-MHQ and catechol resistance regulon transcriptional repressor
MTSADRRARVLELTPEGRLLVEQAFKEHEEDLNGVMSVLDPAEKAQLYGPLKKLGQFAAEALREKTTIEKVG